MMKQALALAMLMMAAEGSAQVVSYFNHNQNNSYTEPYRKILRNGDNLEQVILDEIALAKESIYIAVQELRLPLIARALVKKQRAGVDVRVVLEHDYNFNVVSQKEVPESDEHDTSKVSELRAFVDLNKNGRLERAELEQRDAVWILQSGGIAVIDDTSDESKGSALMHHKFMIVDKKSVLVSTANFTMSCIHGDELNRNSRGNANSMLHIKSADAAKIFLAEFQQLWGKNFGHKKAFRGAQTVDVGGAKLTIQFSPTSRRFGWEESVNGLIAHNLEEAEHSIKAALFVFSEQHLSNILEPLHDEGVDLGVIIEPKFAFRYYSELLDLFGLQLMSAKCTAEQGNRPWKNPIQEGGMALLPQGDVLHHKFAVVDDKKVIVGSQNWSDAANLLNDETLIVIEDSSIAQSFDTEYQRVLSKTLLGVPKRTYVEMKDMHEACEGVFPEALRFFPF